MGGLGGFIPGGGLLALVGSVLVLVALFRAGGELRRPDIGRSVTISVAVAVGAGIVFALMVGSAAVSLFHGGNHTPGAGFGVGVIVGGLLTWALFIAAAWFWYQAMIGMSEGSGVALFKTSGLIYFIGVCTLVVFGLGFIGVLIGQVLQIVAFFSVPDEQPAAAPPTA
jgi:uncharacterized membrane protein